MTQICLYWVRRHFWMLNKLFFNYLYYSSLYVEVEVESQNVYLSDTRIYYTLL